MKTVIPSDVIGVGLVLNRNKELLIDKRLETSSMGGLWEFPGGKQEPNESIENTIERELREEIGIRVEVGKKLISFEYSYSSKKLNFIVHFCEWKSGQPKPLASQKLLWVSANRLDDYSFPPANTKIIAALYKYFDLKNKLI
ncbi:8-oxo-dGTP diphosphatase MutT [Prochlorococcus marinus]|uniref:8-oxo-dGTP diphosphatase MutT n=1 Tax=Prochlorococcus marinus TaxID=1219 RepID=UPI0022B4E6CF|nr:8-oxo-dGTP diphosphatase MutT [Prochlorococcus marinus]